MQIEIDLNLKKRFLFNFLLSVGALVLFFVIFEVGLRIYGKTSDNFLKQDAVLGWVHMPGKSGRSVTGEYSVKVHINKLGLVGPETTVEKPEGVFRIAAIGDSVTEAFQVDEKNSFVRLLETELNKKSPTSYLSTSNVERYEVLNFGVTSYGTVKEYYIFENEVLKFKPDMVLLSFFTGNDFSDNLGENINLSAQFSFYKKSSNSLKLFLRNHLTVYRFFLEKKARNKVLRRVNKVENQTVPNSPPDEALQKTEIYLEKFKKLADENKVRLMILILPSKDQINSPTDSNSALGTFLSGKQIEHFDLLPYFKSWAKINPGSSAFFPVDGHPNENGHKIIADAVVKYFYGK